VPVSLTGGFTKVSVVGVSAGPADVTRTKPSTVAVTASAATQAAFFVGPRIPPPPPVRARPAHRGSVALRCERTGRLSPLTRAPGPGWRTLWGRGAESARGPVGGGAGGPRS